MTIQIESLVAHGRALVAETLIDTGVITRPPSAVPVLNTTTGLLTPAAATVVHTGPCRVKSVGAEQTAIFGEEQVTAQRFIISFPADIPEVRIDDRVSVASAGDSQMASRSFRVVAVESKSVLHSRRLGVEVVS